MDCVYVGLSHLALRPRKSKGRLAFAIDRILATSVVPEPCILGLLALLRFALCSLSLALHFSLYIPV